MRKKQFKRLLLRVLWLLFPLPVCLLLWLTVLHYWQPPVWLLPPPSAVWRRALELHQAGVLAHHLGVTLREIFSGYVLGIGAAFWVAYPISQFSLLEKIATPFLIAANSVPLVAFAPLLMLWFGTGIQTKIIVTALIVFFPVSISILSGFHQVSSVHLRLLQSLHASKWQRFWFLELPSAVPGILAGMKIAAPLAVVGAVVGEFMGTGEGLGHLILEANGLLDTPQLFVAIGLLSSLGIGFYLFTLALDKLLIGSWHPRRRAL